MGRKLHRSVTIFAAVLLVAIFFCPIHSARAETAAENRQVKDKWALVVGISKFQDARINLKYPARDAEDFYNYLVTDGKFTKDHVILLTNDQATRSNILSVIGDKWLPRVANPDDIVVIFISTHGSPADVDVGGVNYLIAYDTSIDELYATGIPIQDLMRTIKKRVHSDRVVMILDACHSGAASAEAKGLYREANVDASVVAGTGQLVIASSKPDQKSWEGKKYPNSVFTKHLIDALKKHGSETSLGEAFASLKERVEQEVLLDRGQLQQPELKSQWKGDQLALSMPPSAPRPGIPLDTLQLSGSVSITKTDHNKLLPNAVPDSAASVPSTPSVNLVLNNGNIYRVFNKPTAPTMFSVPNQSILKYISTYHWNDGRGMQAPGTIALRHVDGTIYGPWQTIGKPGQGGVPNAYWEVEPNVEIKAGTYKLIDSSPRTWAQNAGSGGSGMGQVKVQALH